MNASDDPSGGGPATSPRLALFVPSLAGGGAERALVRLAGGLASRGTQVDLVLARAEGPYLTEVSTQVRVVDLRCSRVMSSLVPLSRYLRRERPSALLSTLDYANIVAIWARRLARSPVRLVVNEQNMITVTAAHSAQKRQQMVPLLIKWFYPWADHVVGNSEDVARALRRLIGVKRTDVRVIYNPIVVPGLRERAAACPGHPWFAPGQPPVVLAIGRLTAQKDFPALIHAFADLRRARPARLIILGEGPDRGALETLITSLDLQDDVRLPGFVINPYAWLARASAFVLSSRWEGLPTVLVEALFCGVPVVATDCPGGSREILADARHGALVPVGDGSALTRAMHNALEGGTPRPTPESWLRYDLDRIVDQYLQLLTGTS